MRASSPRIGLGLKYAGGPIEGPQKSGIGALRMLYQAYQAQSDLMAPVKAFARMALQVMNGPYAGLAKTRWCAIFPPLTR